MTKHFVGAWVSLDEDELRGALDRVRAPVPDLRPVAAARLHLTVLFLGKCDDDVIDCVRPLVVTASGSHGGDLQLGPFAVFGNGRAIVLVPEGESLAGLAALRTRCLAELAEHGLETPDMLTHDQWRPHVTIARTRSPLEPDASANVMSLPPLGTTAQIGPPDLIASVPAPGGHVYRSQVLGLADR